MRPLKVIAIDARNCRVFDAMVVNLESMQALVNGRIEPAIELKNGDEVYVNEDGLADSSIDYGFRLNGSNLLVGNGFIIGGIDRRGGHTNVQSQLKEISESIEWIALTGGEL